MGKRLVSINLLLALLAIHSYMVYNCTTETGALRYGSKEWQEGEVERN
jgi:hypothetical protein